MQQIQSVHYMEQKMLRETALQGLRVLDLCGHATQYCGRMLAQMGADVVLVEPPGGTSTRREGPFLEQRPHPEYSLPFAYFNQGKRGMCLDLEQAQGQSLLRELARNTDVLIEAEPAGAMERRGLGYDDLKKANPGLVMTRITAFGQSGPYAHYAADDLVALAMGGLLYLGGYPDSEPLAAYGHQAYLAAAQFAAVGSLIALWSCEGGGGQGQQVDVSMQECVAMALENAVQFVDLEDTVRRRNGGLQRQAGTGVFACSDGMVYLMAGGIAANRFWSATTEWLVDVGAPGAQALREERWGDMTYLACDEAKERFEAIFLPYAATRTKAELYAEGQRRRIPICPVSTSADLLANEQLRHRRFFQDDAAHPYSGSLLALPGAPYRLTGTPWQAGRPAPRLGEHTSQILETLGYEWQAQQVLLRAGVTG